MENNIAKLTDKSRNEKADAAADIGAKVHGQDIINIASIYESRLRWFTIFMKKIHRHIIEAYAIHRPGIFIVTAGWPHLPSL